MTARLPAHLEVSGLLRTVETSGGFAMVLQRGERDAGTILIVTRERGETAALWERMPQLDGSRLFTKTRNQSDEDSQDFEAYLERRCRQDPDSWLIELDIVNPERFISTLVT